MSWKLRRTNYSGIFTYKRITLYRPDDQTLYNKKKKRTCQIVDFAVPANHWIKLKENEKKDKYFAWELKKKLWNIKVTIIPIIIDVLVTVTKGLIQGLEDLKIRGQVETIQTTALLRSAKIPRRVLATSVRNHWLTLVSKTQKREIMIFCK